VSEKIKTAENNEDGSALTEGYRFVYDDAINNQEFADVLSAAGLGRSTTEDVETDREQAKKDGYEVSIIGVRDSNDSLVGTAILAHRQGSTNGELFDRAVAEEHQHKGIGKAIMDEQLRLADENGLESLYIAEVEPTNTLRPYLMELGFVDNGKDGLQRGSNPGPV